MDKPSINARVDIRRGYRALPLPVRNRREAGRRRDARRSSFAQLWISPTGTPALAHEAERDRVRDGMVLDHVTMTRTSGAGPAPSDDPCPSPATLSREPVAAVQAFASLHQAPFT